MIRAPGLSVKQKSTFPAIFRKGTGQNGKQGLTIRMAWDIKKESVLYSSVEPRSIRRRTVTAPAPTAPGYRPAKQLQKGDHKNGYF